MTQKLLVIDDEKSITMILGKIVAGHDYEVRMVNEPAEAIDAFLSFEPDIVMLDLVMPETDGIDILRLMLNTGRKPRIIVMIGFGAGYVRLARAVGEMSDDCNIVSIEKPFRRSDVLNVLQDRPDVLPGSADRSGVPFPMINDYLGMAAD